MNKKIPLRLLIILLLSTGICACKKNDSGTPAPSIAGFWVGKQGTGATTYPVDSVAALFRSDGTVRYFASTDTARLDPTDPNDITEGTYALSGSTLNAKNTIQVGTFSYQYNVVAIVNGGFTFMEGNWTGGTSTQSTGGKWFMYKK